MPEHDRHATDFDALTSNDSIEAPLSTTSRLNVNSNSTRSDDSRTRTRRRSTTTPVLRRNSELDKTSTPSSSTSNKTKPTKRARVSIPDFESNQVTSLSGSNESEFKLPFYQATIYYLPKFIKKELANDWYDQLLKIPGWYRPTLKMYGKEITQSRKICAYAKDRSLVVRYSGSTVDMQYDYPPLLNQIQELIEERLRVKFNHVMLNLYENGTIYIGNHRDNKENRVIASLSLGAERTFIMTHSPPSIKLSKRSSTLNTNQIVEPQQGEIKYKKWTLENGSLVVMQGDTQRFWKHEIPKEPKIKEGRISLTFRQLIF